MSAIGALRELEKDKKGANNAGLKELFLNLPTRIRQSGPVKGGINFALKSWKTSGRWLWVLSTTLLVTLVPLSIEMLREEQTNEVVKELVSKGFSYNQIQGMGYMVSQPESTLAAPAEGAPSNLTALTFDGAVASRDEVKFTAPSTSGASLAVHFVVVYGIRPREKTQDSMTLGCYASGKERRGWCDGGDSTEHRSCTFVVADELTLLTLLLIDPVLPTSLIQLVAVVLVAFLLLLTLDHDHADESGSTAEEQHEQHRRDADGVVVGQEKLLNGVVLINERLW